LLNRDIRRTALFILINSMLPVLMVASACAFLSSLWGYACISVINGKDVLLNAVCIALTVMRNTLSIYFYIRSWVLGKGRVSFVCEPLKNKLLRKSLIPVIISTLIIYIVLAIPVAIFFAGFVVWVISLVTKYTLNATVLGILAAIYMVFMLFVLAAVSLAWHVWSVRPEYKAAGILGRGFKYTWNNWAGWLWFTITTRFWPILMWNVLGHFISSNIMIILFIPVWAWMFIANAGYIYENILRFEFAREDAYNYTENLISGN